MLSQIVTVHLLIVTTLSCPFQCFHEVTAEHSKVVSAQSISIEEVSTHCCSHCCHSKKPSNPSDNSTPKQADHDCICNGAVTATVQQSADLEQNLQQALIFITEILLPAKYQTAHVDDVHSPSSFPVACCGQDICALISLRLI